MLDASARRERLSRTRASAQTSVCDAMMPTVAASRARVAVVTTTRATMTTTRARVVRPRGTRATRVLARATEGETTETTTTTKSDPVGISDDALEKNLSKFAKKTATTFAPRQSGAAKKNPAFKGSALYTVFEVQAYLAIVVGGLLAFNVIWPSDEPSIARLMGMWSVWMFTVPSLRARECEPAEKDALNLLFVAIPLVNVIIPFFWKSFAGVFSADVLLMAAVYAQKGVFAPVDASAPAADDE